jgi:hypothetical protein
LDDAFPTGYIRRCIPYRRVFDFNPFKHTWISLNISLDAY